jgi:twitching motility protein PilT
MTARELPLPPDILELLRETVNRGASDLHLVADAPPMARLNGALTPIHDQVLDAEMTRDLVFSLLTEHQRARLEEDWELDFAVQVEGLGRFRGNAHFARSALEAAFRFIPAEIPDLLTLGHQPIVSKLCELESGLVIVTGTTGSGKSTTLAAMIKFLSEQRAGVIVTIEDPVEFVFRNARSVVKQREVGSDTHSFAAALRHGLRQDPDVILVGEMRDQETIAAAVTAAETGHLVLGSLHTTDAPGAFTRMVDVFPGDQQPQIVAQLANSLKGIISQRLLPREDGRGRVLASEIIVANTAVRAVIREKKWEQLDDSLAALYANRQISKEEAYFHARDKARIEGLARDTKKRGLFG